MPNYLLSNVWIANENWSWFEKLELAWWCGWAVGVGDWCRGDWFSDINLGLLSEFQLNTDKCISKVGVYSCSVFRYQSIWQYFCIYCQSLGEFGSYVSVSANDRGSLAVMPPFLPLNKGVWRQIRFDAKIQESLAGNSRYLPISPCLCQSIVVPRPTPTPSPTPFPIPISHSLSQSLA